MSRSRCEVGFLGGFSSADAVQLGRQTTIQAATEPRGLAPRPSAGLCCRRNVGRTLPALPRLGSPCAPSTKGAAAWVSSLCPWGRRNMMDRSSSPRTLRSGGLFSSSVSPGKHTDPCKSRACPELGDPRPVSVPPQPRFPHVESRPADDLLAGSCNY